MARHKFWNLWILQKHKNLDISRTKHFFFQLKKIIKHTSGTTLWQKNNFVVEVPFNVDETDILFRTTEDKILHQKSQECSVG